MEAIQPDLSVCLLHHDEHAGALAGFLDSLHTHADPVSFEVILVADRPESEELARLEHGFPDLVILESKPGEPRATAINHALRLAQGRYFCHCAPHLLLRSRTLALLVDFLDENPDVGLAAPRIVDPDGRVLPTARTLPSLTTLLATHPFWGSRLGLASRLPIHLLADRDHLLDMEVEWLLDTLLLIRREVVEEIGLFDEGFACLFADADFCRRARQAGWHLHYLAKAVAVHTQPAPVHALTGSRTEAGDGARFLFKGWLSSLLSRSL
ncbi:MAG: glycosyltransferase [Thermodesulfobacteriota bacterium]